MIFQIKCFKTVAKNISITRLLYEKVVFHAVCLFTHELTAQKYQWVPTVMQRRCALTCLLKVRHYSKWPLLHAPSPPPLNDSYAAPL
jgi:hypothetical protein